MGGGAGRIEWLSRDDVAEDSPGVIRIGFDDARWRATIERFDTSEGLRIFLTSAEVHRDVEFDARRAEPERRLYSHIPVEGPAELRFRDGGAIAVDATRSAFYSPVEGRVVVAIPSQRGLRHVGLSVSADRARRMLGDDLAGAIAGMFGDDGTSRFASTPTGPRLRRLAASLFSHNLRGALRAMFMEGVALQLFALQAELASGRKRGTRHAMSADGARLLARARARLLADMADPPSVAELAAECGLSERALNAGFRSLYGGTVYEVLRDERLAHARSAVVAGVLPIKAIAHRVGYAHVSNFTAAFARRYGMPPARYVRAARGCGGVEAEQAAEGAAEPEALRRTPRLR